MVGPMVRSRIGSLLETTDSRPATPAILENCRLSCKILLDRRPEQALRSSGLRLLPGRSKFSAKDLRSGDQVSPKIGPDPDFFQQTAGADRWIASCG